MVGAWVSTGRCDRVPERAPATTGRSAELSTLGAGAGSVGTACSVSGLSGGRICVRVSALSAAGEGDRSSTVACRLRRRRGWAFELCTDDEQHQPDVERLVALGGSATRGTLCRSDGAGGTDHSIVAYDGSGSTATSATVAGLEGGRSYSFVVAGVSAAGEGSVSETALEQSTSPGAPSGLASSEQTTSSITLGWSAAGSVGTR